MSDAELERQGAAVLDLLRSEPGALLCVVGPTAGGKSALALHLAERLDGEIVGADSVQIYRGFDVGSGKPTAEERARVPHHLIDVADPSSPFDAARFVSLADRAIAEVRARGRTPIVCGGTFLWVKALLSGLSDAPKGDETIRARHRELVAREGSHALHLLLEAADPGLAPRLHPNDVLRVSRALEVFELTGQRLSDLHRAHGFRQRRHAALLVSPARTPEELTGRIRARVESFVTGGLLDEVRALALAGHRETRAMRSVGYREALAAVDGELLDAELVEAITRSTRVFARRQRTWLAREPVHYVT
ncbi:MAG: tRNA (adenosine(37)-N6)-dimethylallyltransferase MiaA [Myxococcales bacterium]|nr:tRNA (adenosine(37)-N6)-dimethylallyltransferase MiaA [Myxococcales bacterium]MBL0196554.1 tRNA (adenosine(37)-N6)-dimethylallyltransferase MiaA [Myxococcales bacterium]HQY65258.1 tRNA (adenosine(37)-N6)-dimethylallyltransferase MiaA [Polyangiaceae bacterium]